MAEDKYLFDITYNDGTKELLTYSFAQLSDAFKTEDLKIVEISQMIHGNKVSWRVFQKPVGGNEFFERVRGAFMVLFNKATFVRWF
jgi:hypothetical protein